MGIVILAAIAAIWLVRGQAIANERVIHTIQVEVAITQLLERSRAIESAHRAYLLGGDERFVADMNRAIHDVAATAAAVRRNTADNPRQQANLDRLEPLLRAKFVFARQGVALMTGGGRDSARALVAGGRGKQLMDAIRARLDVMLTEEQRLLDRRWRATRMLTALLGFGLAGAVFLVVLVAAATVNDAGRRAAAIESARDDAAATADALREQIAARAEAEAQIRQMHKMESIGQLTGGIAHDFNNMLAIVIGSLDMAKRRLANDPEKLEKCIDNAREGAERAAALTARLLAFSRQQPLAPVAIDSNKLVAGMSELLRRTLGDHIAVETVLAGGLWRTFADPGQLENAILNLAVNGRDAMPEGGRLTIETANAHLDDAYARAHSEVTAGQYVQLCVSDTGTGMAPEVIDRAFDPFFTTKEVGKGTGLGLSQVFGFVKQSGGHVSIYSEPGEGTTVKLYLPRWRGPVADLAGPTHSSGSLPEGRADEIILVVEDEQRVRHFSVDALRELGYSAISASNGRDALDLLLEQPLIALLFTDVVMPEMNGRRLADEARARRPGLKILYTTGYTRNAVVHNGMLDAGVAFLPKPFTIAQLAWKVREVLDGGGANRPA